jgi:hypothetical protein
VCFKRLDRRIVIFQEPAPVPPISGARLLETGREVQKRSALCLGWEEGRALNFTDLSAAMEAAGEWLERRMSS